MTIDWGDAPTWLSAIVSAAALGAATMAGVAARNTWRLEHERDLARQDSEKAAQASLVAAYPGWGHELARAEGWLRKDGGWEDPSFGYDCPAVLVRNASELPVYDVVIEAPLPRHAHEHTPGDTSCGCEGPYYAGHVPPGDPHVETLHFEDVEASLISDDLKQWVSDSPSPVDDDGEKIMRTIEEWIHGGRPAISFTDANGQRWLRDAHGRLRMTEPLPGLTVPQVSATKGADRPNSSPTPLPETPTS